MSQATPTLTQLMDDYAHYWRRTLAVRAVAKARGLAALHPPKPTPERLDRLRRMAQFCRMQRLDARRWVYALFEAQRFAAPPQFTALRDAAVRAVYLDGARMRPYDQGVASELSQRGAAAATRAVALNVSILTERLKGVYAQAGDAAMCRADAGRTGGYHPQSALCARCALAAPCARDVAAHHGAAVLSARYAQVAQ